MYKQTLFLSSFVILCIQGAQKDAPMPDVSGQTGSQRITRWDHDNAKYEITEQVSKYGRVTSYTITRVERDGKPENFVLREPFSKKGMYAVFSNQRNMQEAEQEQEQERLASLPPLGAAAKAYTSTLKKERAKHSGSTELPPSSYRKALAASREAGASSEYHSKRLQSSPKGVKGSPSRHSPRLKIGQQQAVAGSADGVSPLRSLMTQATIDSAKKSAPSVSLANRLSAAASEDLQTATEDRSSVKRSDSYKAAVNGSKEDWV